MALGTSISFSKAKRTASKHAASTGTKNRSKSNISKVVLDCTTFLFVPRMDYIYFNKNQATMYSLKCSYYTKQFNTLDELLDDIMTSGMDPNYEITHNGKGTGEQAIDLLQF
jgi:hypothetical protein